jgi:peptidyl-prolyl cis-trans isomerase C
MRGRNIGLCVVISLICGLIWVISGNAASSKFVAKVNGSEIKKTTLDAAMSNFIENQKTFGIEVKEEDKVKLQKDILEELISAELLYQESKKARLGDLKKKINEQMESIKKGFGSNEEFQKILKDRGITESDLKEDIKKGVSIKEFLDQKVYKDLATNDAEKKEEYEKNKERLNVPAQVRASHILVLVKEDTSDEDKKAAREKIEALRGRALSGEDFAALARENSADGSAARGGDLGYFSKGQMVKPFEDAAFSLKIGDISDVVETQFGYHIINLTDKKEPRLLTYEEVQGDIEKFLINKHRREKLDNLVQELRKKAKVDIY